MPTARHDWADQCIQWAGRWDLAHFPWQSRHVNGRCGHMARREPLPELPRYHPADDGLEPWTASTTKSRGT